MFHATTTYGVHTTGRPQTGKYFRTTRNYFLVAGGAALIRTGPHCM